MDTSVLPVTAAPACGPKASASPSRGQADASFAQFPVPRGLQGLLLHLQTRGGKAALELVTKDTEAPSPEAQLLRKSPTPLPRLGMPQELARAPPQSLVLSTAGSPLVE